MRAVVAFIRLGRPLFLVGGALIYALGSVIAGGPIDTRRYVLGQLAVSAFQLMTHYANDYFDLEADRANTTPTRWSGGSRVLVAGELAPRVALGAAVVLAALGLATTAVLGVLAGAGVAAIYLAMVVLAWEYSAPPLRLCATGAGELDTAVVVTVLVPVAGFALQGGGDARMLALALVPLVLLQIAMLLAIEFPDATGDAAAGKRTLVVRFGAPRAARLYAVTTALAYAWLPVAAALGLPARIALVAALPAPVAMWRVVRLADHRDPARHERLAFWAVFLLVATTACELVAFFAWR